jgi:diguanylate cyclase (GGDEF)-like protein
MKSVNMKLGIEGGNHFLIEVADALKETFRDALIIARYGGDEFALAVKVGEGHVITMKQVAEYIETEFSIIVNNRLTLGYAVYPDHGLTKDELISKAEGKLFDMKRVRWLEQEEHILRTEKDYRIFAVF